MAREVIIRIKDDLDDTLVADKTVPFAMHGTHYEIDLTAAHADEFDADMARWIKAAREIVPEPPAHKAKAKRGTYVSAERRPVYEQRQRIRAWGTEVGFEVNSKGSLSVDLVQAYAKTHPDDPILPDTWPPTKGGKRRRAAKHSVESVVAQDGGEQLVTDLFTSKAAATVAARAKESGRFGLSKEMRDKIRAWAIDNGLDQAATGQLKGEVVIAYFEAHPDEAPKK